MSRRLSPARPRIVMVTASALLGLALVACTPEAAPTPEPSLSEQPAPTTAPTPEAPAFHPDGTAEDNLPVFTAVTAKVWASEDKNSGRAYIDALVAAGFNREHMQVTEDLSTVGNPAESMQFSVSWGEEFCLIGQFGPSTGDPVTVVMDQLPEGRCLIGNTRPIDW